MPMYRSYEDFARDELGGCRVHMSLDDVLDGFHGELDFEELPGTKRRRGRDEEDEEE